MSIDFGGIVSTRSLSFPAFESLRHDQGGWSWSFSSSLLNLTQVALSLLTLAM